MKKSFSKLLFEVENLDWSLRERGWAALRDLKTHSSVSCSRTRANRLMEKCFFFSRPGGFGVGLSFSSDAVDEDFLKLGLNLDHQPSKGELGVIAVNLLWLRWNSDASCADSSDAYSFDRLGLQHFLNDLDTVGTEFSDTYSEPIPLARLLMRLDEYPVHCKFGGRPVSNDPYVYAALLARQSGQPSLAREALELGHSAYAVTNNSAKWERVRKDEFDRRAALIQCRLLH